LYGGRGDVRKAEFLYARAAIWIDETMLREDQKPQRTAAAADQSVAALLLE
jgi:hypothetical protein